MRGDIFCHLPSPPFHILDALPVCPLLLLCIGKMFCFVFLGWSRSCMNDHAVVNILAFTQNTYFAASVIYNKTENTSSAREIWVIHCKRIFFLMGMTGLIVFHWLISSHLPFKRQIWFIGFHLQKELQLRRLLYRGINLNSNIFHVKICQETSSLFLLWVNLSNFK